ncbi:MAG: hypothetical protein Q4G66_00970 [bacterium]|nr:hypothetical protein [bacterium]
MPTNKFVQNDFLRVWERIKKETGLTTLVQLSEIIEKTQQNVSASKKKGEFPIEWAFKVGRKYGILTEWILTGEGPKRIGQAQGFFATIEEWAKETGEGNTRWFENQFRAAFPQFVTWEREKKEEANEAYQNQMSA